MTKHYDSRNSWVTLILCFCLGSLLVSPLLFTGGISAPSLYGIDLENSSGFDESDIDDDFSTSAVVDLMIAGLILSRFRSMYLAFASAFLSPDSPPPK
jgi:hypothetical protein